MKCCPSTDVGTWTNWLTFEPDPDYNPDAGTGLLSPLSYIAMLRGILRRENPTYTYWSLQRRVVLQWFHSLRQWAVELEIPLSEVHALHRECPSSLYLSLQVSAKNIPKKTAIFQKRVNILSRNFLRLFPMIVCLNSTNFIFLYRFRSWLTVHLTIYITMYTAFTVYMKMISSKMSRKISNVEGSRRMSRWMPRWMSRRMSRKMSRKTVCSISGLI